MNSRGTIALLPAQLTQLNTPTVENSPTAPPSPTPEATSTGAVTSTATPSATVQLTAIPTPTPTGTDAAGVTGNLSTAQPGSDAVPTETIPSAAAPLASPQVEEDAPLVGTIIANRSQTNARFFVEGRTYELGPERSVGIELPRPTTVLNLYNCDAATPEAQGSCFWDPYLIVQDGFYEVYNAADSATTARLLLREAGAPPTDQVWVQNRIGQIEQVVYKSEIFDLPPTTVQEFGVATGVPAILYVRSCLTLEGQTVCEWAPKTLQAGAYYALVEVESPGAQPGSSTTAVELRPVVAGGEVAAAEATPITAAAGSVTCRLAVPVLNIRSGPGLQYEIVGKVRTTGTEPATVAVTGRSPDDQWFTVAQAGADEGWITSSASFVTCEGDVSGLPVVEAPVPPPTPVGQAPIAAAEPVPAPQAPTPAEQSGDSAVQAATPSPAPEDAEPTAPAIPAGQALIVVNNGFEFDMRFTLDQQYRPNPGPSEYDLAPGESVGIVVYPGDLAFTASSPWNGLSGNATIQVEPDQSTPLWLRFEPDPGRSNQWNLAWQ